MRGAALLAALALAACNQDPPPRFVVGDLKAQEEPVTLTGWYVASERAREFRLYPTPEEHYAKGGGQCVSGIATSLAGVPPDTIDGKQMSITGNLFAAGSPDVGDTRDDCGAGLILVANDISFPEDK